MDGIILTIPGPGDSSVDIFYDMEDPTGFVNRDDSIISFDAVTRTLTLAVRPPATEYAYYIRGVKYTITTTKTIVLPDAYNDYFIYISDGETLGYTSIFDPDVLLRDNAYVSVIVWNDAPSPNTNEVIYFGDERHGITMDNATWAHFHLSFGCQYINGLGLLNMDVDAGTPTDASAQFAVDDGLIRDEDLPHWIRDESSAAREVYDLVQDLSPIAQIPIKFKTGPSGTWNSTTPNDFPFVYSDGVVFTGITNALPPYNEWTGATWQLTEVSDNSYFLMHYFATNDIDEPIIAIQGIENYPGRGQARTNAREEINRLTGLPFQEYTPLATVLVRARTNYSNIPQARFDSVEDGADYIDWRETPLFGSTSHSGSAANPEPRQVIVPALTTETVDSGVFLCPVAKWMVSVHNTTANIVRVLELTAMHDFAGNVTYNTASIMGEAGAVEITADAGANANEIELIVENQSATDSFDVCAFRIIQ